MVSFAMGPAIQSVRNETKFMSIPAVAPRCSTGQRHRVVTALAALRKNAVALCSQDRAETPGHFEYLAPPRIRPAQLERGSRDRPPG